MKTKINLLIFDSEEQMVVAHEGGKLPCVEVSEEDLANEQQNSFKFANRLLDSIGLECVAMTPLFLGKDYQNQERIEVWQPIYWAVKKEETQDAPILERFKLEDVDTAGLFPNSWVGKIYSKTRQT